jgi:hypothetical protein
MVCRYALLTRRAGLTLHITIHAKAFVNVTCNERRLDNNQSTIMLREPWRFRPIVNGLRTTVDYQAFICHGCKIFNAYGFCVHCIMCGIRMSKGVYNTDCSICVYAAVERHCPLTNA